MLLKSDIELAFVQQEQEIVKNDHILRMPSNNISAKSKKILIFP
jgi:hypothetical protein